MYPLIGIAALGLGALLIDSRRENSPAAQAYFDRFHERIRLGEDNEKAELRKKRQILLDDLQANLPLGTPSFEWFNQGSYAMHTGIAPLNSDYDIDIGLIFDCTRAAYKDPVALKVAVRDALKRSRRTVRVRNSCVTAHYLREGQSAYHVDFAVYVKRADGLLDIAKGKEHSEPTRRLWEKSNPQNLTKSLANRFNKDELRQYRRCIRYLKRWRDLHFTSGAPVSIALTVAAYKWFQPQHQLLNLQPLDLLALRNWTKSMLNRFMSVRTAEGNHMRLRVELPVEPKVDLLAKMTKVQMLRLQSALTLLYESLDKASRAPTIEECARLLSEQFGADFR